PSRVAFVCRGTRLEPDHSNDVDEHEQDGEEDEERTADAEDAHHVTSDVLVLDRTACSDEAARDGTDTRTGNGRIATPVAGRGSGRLGRSLLGDDLRLELGGPPLLALAQGNR